MTLFMDDLDSTIAILARAPEPGRSKTRLIPKLGAAGAAALQQRLTARAIDTALALALSFPLPAPTEKYSIWTGLNQ